MNSATREKITKWLLTGKVGLSSKAMASVWLNVPAYNDYPLDPADFNRCLLLLKAVPEMRSQLWQMAHLSEEWKRLVKSWDEIEKSFLQEVGFDWSKGTHAPKTWELMKSILNDES